MGMPVIKALVLVVDILSVVEVLDASELGIGGKIYDDGETANKVSETELEREAASESKVPAVPFPARGFIAAIPKPGLSVLHIIHYYLLDESWSPSTFFIHKQNHGQLSPQSRQE